MLTFGPTAAIGMPSVNVKDCTGIFRNGKLIGGVWFLPGHSDRGSYELVMHRQHIAWFATEQGAREMAEDLESESYGK